MKTMNKANCVKGRLWMIQGPEGELIKDVDTDQIYHNAHLAVTDLEEMGRYAFGNLEGWKDFPEKAKSGDIIAVGANFGAGSSRQHAVDCFRALGIAAIIGESFGAIYKRNAINSGFPLITCPGIGESGLLTGDEIEIDFETGRIARVRGGLIVMAQPFSEVQMDVYKSGGLFAYGKTLENGD
jgi:3-isopropylmalate/(R)-2-methylmalate dehydratase small subunit